MWHRIWNKLTERKPSEKRSETRLDSSVDVKIWAAGKPVPGRAKNISASGMRVSTDSTYEFRVDKQYPVEIYLPMGQTAINAVARVIRVHANSPLHGESAVAFHFTDISEADAVLIRHFVHRRRMERRRLGVAGPQPVIVRALVDGNTVPTVLNDISLLGMNVQVASEDPFRLHALCTLEVEFPRTKRPARVLARVVRIEERCAVAGLVPDTCAPGPGTAWPWQVALEYVDMEVEDRALMENLLANCPAEKRAA